MSLVSVQRCEFTDVIEDDLPVWKGLGGLGISLDTEEARRSGIDLLSPSCATKGLYVLGVPSLRQQTENGGNNIDVHAGLTREEKARILSVLGFTGYHMPPNPERPDPSGYVIPPEENRPSVISVRNGGASLVTALTLAGWLADKFGKQMLIVGAEALGGMRTSDLVRAAGKSVCPDKLIGTTLNGKVPITLITAYALLESNFLGEGGGGDQLNCARPLTGACMSGHIHTGEIAGANNGAIAMLVGRARDGVDNVYLMSGAATPERPMSWIEVPSRSNMAFSSLNKLRGQTGLDLADVHVENYDCFFIAKLLQAAALMGLPLNSATLPQVLQFCAQWETVSPLKNWAAWGISSAKKMDVLIKRLRAGQLETAGIIGNGGVCDSVASVVLTTNRDIAKKIDNKGDTFTVSNPDNWQPLKLQHVPDKLDGASGVIDMMAFQHPVVKKDGAVSQYGSTFVRVLLGKGGCVLTNLSLRGIPDSVFDDLTDRAGVGQVVSLTKQDGVITAVI